MEAGTNVQPYAEVRIQAYIQDIFDLVFYSRFWKQYSSWNTGTLDGVTGVVTNDLTPLITRWSDLKVVVRDQESLPLPVVSSFINPYSITGSSPLYIAAKNTNKIFNVFPITSTGDVQFYIRTKPSDFTSKSVINFDSLVIIYGAAYLYSEDDATNLGATDKFKGIFEARLKQLENLEDIHPIKLSSVKNVIPDHWE